MLILFILFIHRIISELWLFLDLDDWVKRVLPMKCPREKWPEGVALTLRPFHAILVSSSMSVAARFYDGVLERLKNHS